LTIVENQCAVLCMCKLHAVTMLFQTTEGFHAPFGAKRLSAGYM